MNILITGGSRGLGKAIVAGLAANAANSVLFTYNRSEQDAISLEASYPNVRRLRCDFTTKNDVDAFVERVMEMDLDVLINNFSTGYIQEHFHKIEADEFSTRFRGNVFPTIRIAQAVIRKFVKKRAGRIINVLSAYVDGPPPVGLSCYVAEKQYLLSLSQSWANEYLRYNVSSNSVSPSFMETDFNKDLDPRMVESLRAQQPLKKFISPTDVVPVIKFLSEASIHITGQNIIVK